MGAWKELFTFDPNRYFVNRFMGDPSYTVIGIDRILNSIVVIFFAFSEIHAERSASCSQGDRIQVWEWRLRIHGSCTVQCTSSVCIVTRRDVQFSDIIVLTVTKWIECIIYHAEWLYQQWTQIASILYTPDHVFKWPSLQSTVFNPRSAKESIIRSAKKLTS